MISHQNNTQSWLTIEKCGVLVGVCDVPANVLLHTFKNAKEKEANKDNADDDDDDDDEGFPKLPLFTILNTSGLSQKKHDIDQVLELCKYVDLMVPNMKEVRSC